MIIFAILWATQFNLFFGALQIWRQSLFVPVLAYSITKLRLKGSYSVSEGGAKDIVLVGSPRACLAPF